MKKVSEHPLFIFLGIIATLLTLFGFFTDRFSIQQIVRKEETGIPTPFPTEIHGLVEPTTVVDSPSQSTPTPRPTSTTTLSAISQHFEIDNPSVSIAIHDNGSGSQNGTLLFQILVAGRPQQDTEIEIAPVTQDIAGEWSVFWPDGLSLTTSDAYQATDQNGYVEHSFPPGMYAILDDDSRASKWCNKLGGTWGIRGYESNVPKDMIVFPIESGKTTEVTVSLGVLAVGLLKEDGSALKDEFVYVYPQEVDVSGKPIYDKAEEELCSTGATGLAGFALGSGTYIIVIPFPDAWDPQIKENIEIKPGEIHQEIITTQN